MEHEITVPKFSIPDRIKINRTRAVVMLSLAAIGFLVVSLGSETLTLTTYYPAPYGAYAAMLTTQQTLLARDGGSVGIGVRRPQAKLDVAAGDPPKPNDGFLPPRMSTEGREGLSALWTPAERIAKKGLLVYDNTLSSLYTWDGDGWRIVGGGGWEWKTVNLSGTEPFNPTCLYEFKTVAHTGGYRMQRPTLVEGAYIADEAAHHGITALNKNYKCITYTYPTEQCYDGEYIQAIYETCPSGVTGIGH